MTTRWSDPEVTMARPPARRPVDWGNVLLWLGVPLVFWVPVLFALYELGVF
jgi:hypothetical protein